MPYDSYDFLFAEKMYNMTRHPAVVNLQQQYGDYITSLNSINLGDMADQYTSAMYNAREKISARLVGLKDRFNSPIVQHVSISWLTGNAHHIINEF